MQGFLTPEQRSVLLHELKVERHAKFSDRIKTILLLDDGGKRCHLSDKEKEQLSNYLQTKL